MKPYLAGIVFLACLCFALVADAAGHYSLCSPAAFDTSDLSFMAPDISQASRVLPQQGAKLNYTQIMFDHPQVPGADEYLLEVTFDDGAPIFNHPLFKHTDSSTADMLGNFEFGKKYVWRYTGLQHGKELGWNGPYNFEILNYARANIEQYRVRVLQNDSNANAGGLVILGKPGCIIDRKGNFVWFLPYSPDYSIPPGPKDLPEMDVGDMRLSPVGSLTFLNAGKAEERDLNGNLIWQGPDKMTSGLDTSDMGLHWEYHHCFERLVNGNYMILGRAGWSGFRRAVQSPAAPATNGINTGKFELAKEFIFEFNHSGNLVWKWSAETYFDSAEIKKMANMKVDPGLNNPEPGGHMNAFDVDERNGFVYLGFRNVSREIKIVKKTGLVAWTAGDNMVYKGVRNGDGFFSKQHGTTLMRDGSIAVFSNGGTGTAGNGEQSPGFSSVVIFTQPTATGNSRLTWKYECRFDSIGGKSLNGGNVDEMENGNLLVCMGAVNRVFEITRDKRIVWNAEEPNASSRAHYASSLYPCYFSVQTNTNLQHNKQVKIFNDGSEDDAYIVDILSLSGNYRKQFSTAKIHAKKSITINIFPDSYLDPAEIVTVTVTSKTNPAFKRVVVVR